jgi:hypothetical protein
MLTHYSRLCNSEILTTTGNAQIVALPNPSLGEYVLTILLSLLGSRIVIARDRDISSVAAALNSSSP